MLECTCNCICCGEVSFFVPSVQDPCEFKCPSCGRWIRGQPVTSSLDPAWLSTDVVGIAQGIFDEYAFDRLPILADALEDAGCTDADILDHCRHALRHNAGCWIVDQILGKSLHPQPKRPTSRRQKPTQHASRGSIIQAVRSAWRRWRRRP